MEVGVEVEGGVPGFVRLAVAAAAADRGDAGFLFCFFLFFVNSLTREDLSARLATASTEN